MTSSLGHVPAGPRWAFDDAVTGCFDDMLARSIPQYAAMRALVADLAVRHFRDGTAVVDLGCSRGEALAPLVATLGTRASAFVGVEVSPPMLAAARARFFGEEWSNVRILDLDLRRSYPNEHRASVTLAVLTLQFTPIEHRQRIVRDVYRQTVDGGAFLLVEKVLGASADIDASLVGAYYDIKRANGYSDDEIERKRLALEGVLVPVTARWNEELLRGAGFREVDCVWRHLNFAAWLAIK